MAALVAEIDYTWRLDLYNHALPPFHKIITGLVDVFPVPVAQPADWYAATLYYQPKYKYCCLKWQIAVSLLGDIISFSGPHFGCEADVTIWEKTW